MIRAAPNAKLRRLDWIRHAGGAAPIAKIEPGVYEPRDDIRVFDGAEDDMDAEGSRLPLLIVIALLVLAAFAGVVYLAYTEGVQKGRSDAPRVITAQNGPAKVAPTDAGGTATP